MRRLLVVHRRLWLRGKGLLLEPGVVLLEGERLRAGDQVVLRRPDGSNFEVMIQGTLTDSGPNSSGRVHLMLESPNKEEVPIGTEVWSTVA